jgi:hypothetical protein
MAGFLASGPPVLNWALFNCFVSERDAATGAFLFPYNTGKSLNNMVPDLMTANAPPPIYCPGKDKRDG